MLADRKGKEATKLKEKILKKPQPKKLQNVVWKDVIFAENTSRKQILSEKKNTLNYKLYSEITNVLCHPEESIQTMVPSNDYISKPKSLRPKCFFFE